VREVALLAYPVVLQTLAETAMQVIDTAMVGRLGATELGAVGFAGIWIWTLFVPFAGTASGVQTFVSRHDGAREHTQCGPWIWHALWLVLPAMTLWTLCIGLFLPSLVALVGPSQALQESAVSYGLARLPGGPAIAANFVLTSFFRGIGDTRTPLKASLVGVSVNVLLAYHLIFGANGAPELGVAGAGLAMSAGSWTITSVLLFHVLRPALRARYQTSWRALDPIAARRFLTTAAPIGGQWLLEMTSFAIFTSIVARMGDASMAASQAMLQLLSLSFMQVIAVSIATSTMVGRYLGAGDLEAAERSYRSSQLLALGVCAIVAAVFVTIPSALIGLFSSDPRVLELSRPLLTLGAFFQVVDAIAIVTSGALRGAGDTRWPFVVQATFAWAVRLPVVYVAAILLGGGVFGAWAGELVYLLALTWAFTARFRAGNWRTVAI
jgi:MATE family multidrug resistance protein